jgi:hypothetical protein
MAIQQLNATAFNGARTMDWFGPSAMPGDPANLTSNAYADPAGVRSVTVMPASPTQVITVNVCSPLGLRANVQAGTGMLLATNVTASPLRLQWSQGVRSVGAFVVAQAAFGTPFTAVMWVWLAQAAAWESVALQGVTGDIWMKAGDTVAPFIAAQAPPGDAITQVYFDAVHPSTQLFSPLGIGRLYFVEA